MVLQSPANMPLYRRLSMNFNKKPTLKQKIVSLNYKLLGSIATSLAPCTDNLSIFHHRRMIYCSLRL